MDKKQIITTSACRINNYNKDIIFTLRDYKGLYIGNNENYQQLGIYDNTTGTLTKIAENTKLLNLLTGTLSHIALASLIASGKYDINDIIEFYTIAKRLNLKYYDFISEQENKQLYKLTTKQSRKN